MPDDHNGYGGSVIAGHFNEPDTYATRRPHGMTDWLITYTLDGEGYCRTPELDLTCRAGDVTILRPQTPHQYGTMPGQRWHFVWAHFSQHTLETYLLPEAGLYQQSLSNSSSRRRVYRAFQRILADARQQSRYGQELCMNALREIFLLLLQRSEQRVDPRIEEALHLLAARLHEPVQIVTLARSIGLSESRLSHLFKQCTGHSIIDTVNRMRVQQAALLMEHTDRSASEVCSDVGYQNYNHFSNQFRKVYAMSPTQYRQTRRRSR